MQLLIVTGMSGAGKSTVLDQLEDKGYFCVDNLPIRLLGKFVQLSAGSGEERRMAAGIDIRDLASFGYFEEALEEICGYGAKYKILFLDASDEVLIKRYKETRRNHPLAGAGRVEDGIRTERVKMEFLRRNADYIIDTSLLLVRDLKQEIDRIFVNEGAYRDLFVTVLSFGFKYGIPQDADLVFDVRFLPNPYYVDELKKKTGLDAEVRAFLDAYPQTAEFAGRLEEMIRFLIPHYIKEGKHQLVIALGCTGGQHRSVAMADELYRRLLKDRDFGLRAEHRDLRKDLLRKE